MHAATDFSDARARSATRRTAAVLGVIAFSAMTSACSSEQAESETPVMTQDPSTSASAPASPATPESPSSAEDVDETSYEDGEYSAEGWYGSGPSHQDVTLTIEGDLVTAVQITTPAENETSLG